MQLKTILFELTKHEDAINSIDAEFMDRVVHILNQLQNEEAENTPLPGGSNQD